MTASLDLHPGGFSSVEVDVDWMVRAVGRPHNWLTVDADEAPRAWAALRAWVEWFRAEFVLDHRVVPPCWYLHPALTNLLTAIRDHWLDAYGSAGPITGPSTWHQAMIQLEARLREWAGRTGCTGSAHRDDVCPDYPDDDEAWAAHVAADVDRRQRRRPPARADRNAAS